MPTSNKEYTTLGKSKKLSKNELIRVIGVYDVSILNLPLCARVCQAISFIANLAKLNLFPKSKTHSVLLYFFNFLYEFCKK